MAHPVQHRHGSAVWTAPLLVDTAGSLVVDRFGGCVVTTPTTLSAYSPDGRRVWDSPVGELVTEAPLIAPDGVLLRIEGELVVARHPATGRVLRPFPAPHGRDLVQAWGDLLYSEVDPAGIARLHCVARSSRHRWSIALDDAGPGHPPFPLADLIVVQRRGLLWGIDRYRQARWVADPSGMRLPHPQDDRQHSPAGVVLDAPPMYCDPAQVLVGLSWHAGRGLYALDATAPRLSPVPAARPLFHPYTMIPASPSGSRVVARAEPAEVVAAVDPDGTVAWEQHLAAPVRTLASAGPDRLLVSTDAAVGCIGADGAREWTWQAPEPLTHPPLVAPGGIVYVGAGGKLWALAVTN